MVIIGITTILSRTAGLGQILGANFMKPHQGTGSIGKALEILELFSFSKESFSVSEIADELEIPFSTAHRICNFLTERGFLYRNIKTKRLSLGTKIYYLGKVAHNSKNIANIALPVMQRIRDDINETVNLYFREGNSRICLEQAQSRQSLMHASPIGKKWPLWAGASGKCFLAFSDEKESLNITSKARPLTPNTILKQEEFKKEFRKIRNQGYAISEAERELGVSSVAAPISEPDGTIRACLAISGPSARYYGEHLDKIIKATIEGAIEITKGLAEGIQN